jgi:glycosyltransferase involved in cell wall biosynthesis
VPTILHIHWLHLVLKDARTDAEAQGLVDRFLRLIDDHRAAGGRIAWTVHNILPHSTRFEDLEVRLSREVAARSHVIHVMAESTAEQVAPIFELPRERLLHVPHMSYLGAYEDDVSRLDARHELGIAADDFVFAAIGAIRPYKGLDTLLDAWQALEPDGARRLIIAGAPSEEEGIDTIVARAALDTTVIIDARKIPADEMQVFLRAADCAVLPYVRALNSGALALALTFGVPVIVPAGGGLEAMADPAFARTFPPGGPDELAAALRGAPAWIDDAARAAARKRAAELAPAVIAEQFAVGLRARLEAVTG